MRRLIRLAVVVALTVWAWRLLVARRGPHERAGVVVRGRVVARARARHSRVRASRRGGSAGASRVSVHEDDVELGRLVVERALLEGDFVLRSGKRSTWYLDKYRFETEPELLRALGERLARVASACEPDAVRLAGPALGAVALAASAAMASGLPVHHRAR